MRKLHKNTVKATIIKNGHWTGFLTANKVNPSQIDGCWYLGIKVTVTSLEELERIIGRFTFYNCNNELGNRVSFYENR